LTAPARVDDDDVFSAGLSVSDLAIETFALWAPYADESISVKTPEGDIVSTERFHSDLYVRSGDRRVSLDMLLKACRATLVPRNGKVGIVLDAPTGGSGTLSDVATVTLTDSDRDGEKLPTFPTDVLEGMTCKMLDGDDVGLTRLIESNDENSWVLASAFPNAAPGDKYAIFAVELTVDNVDDVHVSHVKPSNEHTVKEDEVTLEATTEWQQAVRHGWFQVRSERDRNFKFEIQNANIEALPLEVGDLVLLNHDVNGIEDQLVRADRVTSSGNQTFNIEARIYVEHVYLETLTRSRSRRT